MISVFNKARAMRAKRDEGASAVEYGLLVAAIAAVIVLVVFALGTQIQGAFTKTCQDIATGSNTAKPANC